MRHRPTPTKPAERGVWLTRLAFALAAAAVLARATLLETLRNPLDVSPGGDPVPRGPGAGTGLLLDLLCCVPALLVLVRRAVDPGYTLRFSRSFLPLAGLALWCLGSVLWAGDRFAAAVSAFHWLSASVLLWSAAQLVRDWKHVRLTAAVCFGLLLVQLGEGFYKKYVEFPELRVQFERTKDEFLRQRGWDPGSFQAKQFERKIISGEIMGFTSSENSYGAVVVLLAFVAAGVTLQRLADRDEPAWAAATGAGVVLAAVMIAHLGSRTAYATPVIGAAALAGAWLLRGWLARRQRLAFTVGVAAVVLGLAAVVGHGLFHGSLPGASLAFRWRYWTASAGLFTRHPLLGVGWENFGPHYLSVRLPVAAEEIKDPHNFLVRFATELGAVGLALVLAWMLLLWRGLTSPTAPPATTDGPDPGPGAIPPLKTIGPGAAAANPSASAALRTILSVGVAGVALNVLAGVDWGQSLPFVSLELMRRVGHLCLFVVGASAVALRSSRRQELDDRPAPWVLCGIVVGLGLFLVHNLLDFSLFEPGPMTLFMFLAGAALGSRLSGVPGRTGAEAGRGAWAAPVLGGVAWLAVAGAFAAPVVTAEHAADDADDALRARAVEAAAEGYGRALQSVPYNADYAFRAGRALMYAADPRRHAERIVGFFDRALSLDPHRPEYWLLRADSETLRPAPDPARVLSGYDQALRLDPNNVQMRLDYAAALAKLGDPAAAREQLAAALRYDDLLSPDEPKRLSPAKVAEVRKAISELDARPRAASGAGRAYGSA